MPGEIRAAAHWTRKKPLWEGIPLILLTYMMHVNGCTIRSLIAATLEGRAAGLTVAIRPSIAVKGHCAVLEKIKGHNIQLFETNRCLS